MDDLSDDEIFGNLGSASAGVSAAEALLEAQAGGDIDGMNFAFLQAQAEDPVSALMGLAFVAHWAINDAAKMHDRDPADYRRDLMAWCRQTLADAVDEDSP